MKRIIPLILLGVLLYGVYQLYDASDNRIIKLLESNGTSDKVRGAYKAGERGDKKFVPYLLKNAADPAMSTHIYFKGFSVYQEKMWALEKIYKKLPPHPVKQFDDPDSVNIKFYMDLYERDKTSN